jgi:hypothetical protein
MVEKIKAKVTQEQLEIAREHGIAVPTVYARLKNGWELERAITEPPKQLSQFSKLERNAEGCLVADKPRGKIRSIKLDQDLDELADQAIAVSGLTMGEWFSNLVREYLK